jgi:hypothetical protein
MTIVENHRMSIYYLSKILLDVLIFLCFRYDGNSDLGYRLYREEVKFEFKPNWKRKGRLTEPKMEFHWETIAANRDEFQEISVRLVEVLLSSSSL